MIPLCRQLESSIESAPLLRPDNPNCQVAIVLGQTWKTSDFTDTALRYVQVSSSEVSTVLLSFLNFSARDLPRFLSVHQ